MADIGVAIVGFGLGGKLFHAPFIEAIPGLKLTAIVQRRSAEAQLVYPEVRILRSPSEAFQDPSIVLVVIATPHETHYDLAERALLSGKHVVLDKPFTTSSAEARDLIEIAKEKKRVLAPFHNRRWDGDFKTVSKLIGRGDLGRLVTFESRFDRYSPFQLQDTWKESSHQANGLVFDLASHLIDQACALFGIPDSLTAFVRHDRDATKIDDAFDIVLHYPRLTAYCRGTRLAAEATPRFLLHGTKGSFCKWGVDPQHAALASGAVVPPLNDSHVWLGEREEDWGTVTAAPDSAMPSALTRTKVKTELGDYRGFYANVRDVIQSRETLAVTPEDGYTNIRLLELGHQSAAERRTVPFVG